MLIGCQELKTLTESDITVKFIEDNITEILAKNKDFVKEDYFALMPAILQIVSNKELKTRFYGLVSDFQLNYHNKYSSYISADYNAYFKEKNRKSILGHPEPSPVKEESVEPTPPQEPTNFIVNGISIKGNKDLNIDFIEDNWKSIDPLLPYFEEKDFFVLISILREERRTTLKYRDILSGIKLRFRDKFLSSLDSQYYSKFYNKRKKESINSQEFPTTQKKGTVIANIDLSKVTELPLNFVLENRVEIFSKCDEFTKEEFQLLIPGITLHLKDTTNRKKYDYFYDYLQGMKMKYILKFKECLFDLCDFCSIKSSGKIYECPNYVKPEVIPALETEPPVINTTLKKLHVIKPTVIVSGKQIEIKDDRLDLIAVINLENDVLDIGSEYLPQPTTIKTSKGVKTLEEIEELMLKLDKFYAALEILN